MFCNSGLDGYLSIRNVGCGCRKEDSGDIVADGVSHNKGACPLVMKNIFMFDATFCYVVHLYIKNIS